MKIKHNKLIITVSILLVTVAFFISKNLAPNIEDLTAEKRKQLEAFVKNSPYTETLTWDKKKRKNNGLPPNRYYEQMWELSINPTTGKLDDGELTALRESLIKKRALRKTPGDATNAWEERGPNNVGGRTRVIMFDPNDSSNNTVFAGGVSGGLWKNTNISNANSQWSRVQNVPGNLSVTSITVDPRNSNRWYVGTGEQYTAGDVVGNGVYVTTDGGTNWSALTIPAAGPDSFDFNASNLFLKGIYYVNDVLAWDNGSSTELFVAVGAHVYGSAANPSNWLGLQSSGIYRSTNGGSSWSRIESTNLSFNFGGSNYYYIPNDFEVGADNKIWMGTIGSALGEGGGRVYSSSNGATWTEAAASPLTDSNRVELETSATNANKIYALTQGISSPVHIYQTTNGFASITSRSLPNDADTGIPANDFCRGQSFYDLVIEADPANDNILYVGGIDLFKSTNSGSSWSQLSHWYGGFNQPNNVHADQHSIAFGNNSSSKILFGNDGGVYYSGNSGGTISVRNNNYNVTQFVKAGIGPDGAGDTIGIFTAGAQDNGTQAFRDANTNPGINSSEFLSDGDGFYTFVDKDGQYMIATYVYNVIYRFNLPWDGRGRQQGGSTQLLNERSTGDFVNPMDYDSNANRLLTNSSVGSSFSIKSINVAANSNGNLTNNALTAKPTAFRASPFANNTWFVGLANGGLIKLTNVTNSSASFTTINNPFVGSISSVRFGQTANDIIVTIHNYGVASVWYSSNGGASWQNKEGSLPNIPVRDFLQNPLATNEAILATQLGVWSTENFGDANPNWVQSYNGMSDVSVTSFDYWNVSGDNTNNKIIASTYGRGVFTGKFTANSTADTQAPTVPTNLSSSNITNTQVALNWSASTDNVAVDSYDIINNGSIVGNTSNTSFTVNGLSPNTTYAFTIRAKDAAGNVSNSSNAISITTTSAQTNYCASQSSIVYYQFISRVQLNTIDNTSNDQFYSDFTSISTSLTRGRQYTITVTPTWTITKYSEGFAVWIDYNNDGDFTDAGEQVLSVAPNQNATSSSTFTVPANADLSATRMRVSMSNNEIPTPCQSITWGEVEDYTINIESAPVDTIAPVIALNGSSTINLNVGDTYTEQGATATDNVDGNLTSSIITSGSVNTNTAGTYTINYNVSDVAGNAARQVSRTINVNAIASNGCSSQVTAFPYSESFEGNLGAWSQNTNDNLNWSINTNGTPSGNTGPSSAFDGNSYIFVEASGSGNGFPNKGAILTSPCFDLSTETAATFSFNYHMYGANNRMGSITLEASTDNGVNWTSIWSEANTNKGNNWLLVNVDLQAYVGKNLQLRFNRITGDTWQADIALDNFILNSEGGNNPDNSCTAQVTSFPYNQGFENNLGAWSQNTNDNLNWSINTNGTPSGNTGPSSAFDGNSYIFVEASGSGYGFPNKGAILTSPCFDLSTETAATFSFNYHMYGANNRMGSITLEASTDNGVNWTSVWSEANTNKGNNWLLVNVDLQAYVGNNLQLRFNRITGDTWQADIALDNFILNSEGGNSQNNGCTAQVTSFPYNQGFENNLDSWTQNANDDLNWSIDSNGTPSNNTGPANAIEGNSYIFVEASGSATPNKAAILTSPCIDLSKLPNASFNFNYHMYGSSNMGTLDVEISNDNGTSWTSIWTQSGNKGNQWLAASLDLSAYLNNTIQLRFNRVTGGTWQADVAVDNISLSNNAANNTPLFGSFETSFTSEAFKVYPNPAKSILNVDLTTNGNNTFKIINAIGQTVLSGKLTTQPININRLKIGVYIIEINDEEEILRTKFVKR